jgi:hypothetical protein
MNAMHVSSTCIVCNASVLALSTQLQDLGFESRVSNVFIIIKINSGWSLGMAIPSFHAEKGAF